MTDLNPQRVLVTAGAAGIGRAIAQAFAAAGARVHVCDLDAAALQALRAETPGISTSVCDIGDREAIGTMAQEGLVHGDLSAYNLLAQGERVVIIDLPQVVDLIGNPTGMDYLMRDCTNVCGWFRARGLDVDEHELFSEVVAHAI